MATKPSNKSAATAKAGSKASPESAPAKKTKAGGAQASSGKKEAAAAGKPAAGESKTKSVSQPSSKKPAASSAKSEDATPGTPVPSSVKKPATSKEEKAPAARKAKAADKKPAAKADAKPEAAPKTKAKAEPKEKVKEEAKSVEPAPVAKVEVGVEPPVKPEPKEKESKSKKSSVTIATGPALAPVSSPPPRIKKPILDSAPDVVIKQSYNPAKLPPFIKKQQQRLIELRSALLDSMDIVAKDSLRNRPEGSEASVGGMHMADAGSDAYDRDFALSMLSKEQDALYEINEALDRVGQGVYGVCELSGEKINEERLEALPYTRYTREMQELIEKDQMGGRLRRAPVRSVFGLEEDGEDGEDGEDEDRPSNNNQSESSLDFMKE